MIPQSKMLWHPRMNWPWFLCAALLSVVHPTPAWSQLVGTPTYDPNRLFAYVGAIETSISLGGDVRATPELAAFVRNHLTAALAGLLPLENISVRPLNSLPSYINESVVLRVNFRLATRNTGTACLVAHTLDGFRPAIPEHNVPQLNSGGILDVTQLNGPCSEMAIKPLMQRTLDNQLVAPLIDWKKRAEGANKR